MFSKDSKMSSSLFCLVFCFVVGNLQAKKCGTQDFLTSYFQNIGPQQETQKKPFQEIPFRSKFILNKKTLGNDRVPARIYRTEHFLLIYTLAGLHRVRYNDQEEFDLLAQAESILALENDSLLQYYYDTLTAPHPAIVLAYAESFELSYRHYVDVLKMTKAKTTSFSNFFRTPNVDGFFSVEIVDINETPYSPYFVPIYGLAIPEGETFPSSVLVENDFLYRSFSGQFLPIQISYYNKENQLVNINYFEKWEKGVKVTAIHEYYHAIQFNYTPKVVYEYFTYWHELSATGMEERLATEVNDYVQDLPLLFHTHNRYSTNSSSIESFGHSIFHQYLTDQLGIAFDVKVWENIRGGDHVDQALAQTFSLLGFNFKELYLNYTRVLPFSRSLLTADFFEPFNADQDSIWPILRSLSFVDVEISKTIKEVTVELPHLTYEMIDLTKTQQFNVLIESGQDTVGVTWVYKDRWFSDIRTSNMLMTGKGLQYIVLTNPNFTGNIEIKVRRNIPTLNPNPALGTNATVSFSGFNIEDDEMIQIFDEFLSPLGSFMVSENDSIWDLTLGESSRLMNGIYFYKAGNFSLLPFSINP